MGRFVNTDVAPGAIGSDTRVPVCLLVVTKAKRDTGLGDAGYEAGEQTEDAES